MTRLTLFFAGLVLGAVLFGGAGALLFDGSAIASEEVTAVDGALWLESSPVERKSFIVGVGNLMAFEKLYQDGAEVKPSDDQTIIQRMWAGSEGTTLDGVERTITGWYEKNPGKKKTAVIVVIWEQIVEPGLKKANRK